MRFYSKSLFVFASALTVMGSAAAQSNVQCVMNANGVMEAALVWRNTLGAERANALCRAASVPQKMVSTQQHQAHAPSSYPAGSVQRSEEYQPLFGSRTGASEEYVPMFTR